MPRRKVTGGDRPVVPSTMGNPDADTVIGENLTGVDGDLPGVIPSDEADPLGRLTSVRESSMN